MSADAEDRDVEQRLSAALGAEMAGRLRAIRNSAPKMFDSYADLREHLFRDITDGEQGIPNVYRELIVVAIDVLHGNSTGAAIHARAAVDAGATREQFGDLIGLLYLTSGIVPVQGAGVDALIAATQRVGERSSS